MKTIYKYPIDVIGWQSLNMPAEAMIIHAGLDPQGALCLWAEVDTEAIMQSVGIVIVGTGHPFNGAMAQHLGTVLQNEFVWHIFCETP